MIARTLCRKDWTYVTMVNSKAGQVETVVAVSVPLFILLQCQCTLCSSESIPKGSEIVVPWQHDGIMQCKDAAEHKTDSQSCRDEIGGVAAPTMCSGSYLFLGGVWGGGLLASISPFCCWKCRRCAVRRDRTIQNGNFARMLNCNNG